MIQKSNKLESPLLGILNLLLPLQIEDSAQQGEIKEKHLIFIRPCRSPKNGSGQHPKGASSKVWDPTLSCQYWRGQLQGLTAGDFLLIFNCCNGIKVRGRGCQVASSQTIQRDRFADTFKLHQKELKPVEQ